MCIGSVKLMATRKDAREAVIQILYAVNSGNEGMLNMLDRFLKEKKIVNKQADFAISLINGVCEHNDFIMDTMHIFLKTWDIDRLGVIEKCILQLGIYELLYTQTQKAVVINEAIELTKDFNVSDAFRLVNGVLDAISKVSIDEISNRISSAKLASIDSNIESSSAKKQKGPRKERTNNAYTKSRSANIKSSTKVRDSKKTKVSSTKTSKATKMNNAKE